MKIRRTVLSALVVVAIFGAMSLVGVLLANAVQKAWANKDTWTTEAKLIFPQEASNLRVSRQVTATNSGETFSFHADYCYLYAITKTSDTSKVTLKCSLLPVYYAEKLTNVTKEWQERSDILMEISKEDPAPTSFLGRIDLSFQSISELGSKKIPVSISITGETSLPKKTVSAAMSHFIAVLFGRKTEVAVKFTGYDVKRLDNATDIQKEEYARNWVKRVNNLIKTDFVSLQAQKVGAIEKLKVFKQYFTPSALKCADLVSCVPGYDRNPAEKVAYFMYGLSQSDRSDFAKFMEEFNTSLYPFTPKYPAITKEQVAESGGINWTVFTVYNFPICPIVEVIKGTTSGATVFFGTYAKNVALDAEVIKSNEAVLNEYKDSLWVEGAGWDSDFIKQFDRVCGYVFTNQGIGSASLKQSLVDVYFNMLSIQTGSKVTHDKNSAINEIYEKSAYSPYLSPLLLDASLMNERQNGGIETIDKQGSAYVEWKSLLNSLIFVYLYETL